MREIDRSHMTFLKRSNEFDRWCRQNQLDKWNIDRVGKVDERETWIKTNAMSEIGDVARIDEVHEANRDWMDEMNALGEMNKIYGAKEI